MPHFPLSELAKSLPGVVGIRLEAEPRFEVVEKLGELEVRRYLPEARAQVRLPGSRSEALDAAFEILAGYLFGKNAERREMSMTVPVYAEPVVEARGSEWLVSFFLSNDQVPAELPQPEDPRVELVRTPERYVASLRYTGNNTEEHAVECSGRLLAALRQQSHYLAAGAPYFCQYDAPFTVPFLKRNEVHVPVHEPGESRS